MDVTPRQGRDTGAECPERRAMKKQAKRLSLSRETLNLLDGDNLTKVNGGYVPAPTRNAADTCSINVCYTDSCHYTTCY